MFCPVATRFELAKASRVWRQGVPTALVMDQGLHMLQDAESVQVLTHCNNHVVIGNLHCIALLHDDS